MPVFPSYTSAYFQYISLERSPGDLPSSFTVEFPKDDFADSAGGQLLNGVVFTTDDASDYSVPYRVYDFELVNGYYYNVYHPGQSGGNYLIYKVTLTSFEGVSVTTEQISVLGYEYVYLYSRSVGSVFYTSYTFRFIDRNGLPPGLDYDFSNPVIGSPNSGSIMNWLYDFGNSVYSFFPSISDFLNTQIIGQSFSWILTQGLLVYCGWVIVKFIVGVVT